MPSRSSSSGMTLVEVLLALTILTVAAVGMIQAASSCLAVAKRARNFEVARRVLDVARLEHPLIKTNFVGDLEVRGVTYQDRFTFSRRIMETEEDEDLFVVEMRVTWPDRGRTSFIEAMGYLYSTNHP